MYPRIPGWWVEMGKMAQRCQTAGEKLLDGFGTQTSPPRTFWTAFLRKSVHRHLGLPSFAPQDPARENCLTPSAQRDRHTDANRTDPEPHSRAPQALAASATTPDQPPPTCRQLEAEERATGPPTPGRRRRRLPVPQGWTPRNQSILPQWTGPQESDCRWMRGCWPGPPLAQTWFLERPGAGGWGRRGRRAAIQQMGLRPRATAWLGANQTPQIQASGLQKKMLQPKP